MKFNTKIIASEIHEGLHHTEDEQLAKPALDEAFIDQLVSRLGHAMRQRWENSYEQVLEWRYQDNPPASQTVPGVSESLKGQQLVSLVVPPKSNNQLIVKSILVVYDPSVTLLWLAVGDISFPLVPEVKGFTYLPDIFTKLTSGSNRLLQVVTGSNPSRLGLFINSVDAMQDGRS